MGQESTGCGVSQWQLSYPNFNRQSPGSHCLLGTHWHVAGPLWSPLPEVVSGPAGHETGPGELGWGAGAPSTPDTHPDGSLRHGICEMTDSALKNSWRSLSEPQYLICNGKL